MDLSKTEFTGYYQTVCLNGHQQDALIEKLNVNHDYGFCKLCGEKIIDSCPNCGSFFIGCNDRTIAYNEPIPKYCYNCSKALPWTIKELQSFNELLDLEEQLSDEEKDKIKSYIPDLMEESPTTEINASIVKVYISKASKDIGALIYNFLVDTVSETARKILTGS